MRPIWASDPHFMLVFHLKSFIFAFHHTILERAFKELERGNIAPVAYLSLFVPAALGADMLRQGIKGAFDDEDDERNYRGGWTAMDWLSHGAQRSGVAGVGELWSSAFFDSSTGGNGMVPPALEQASDLAKATVSEEGGLDRELVKALPLQTVLRPWLF